MTDPTWLAAQRRALVTFAAKAADPAGGFGWLDASGGRVAEQPVATWITARMTHVFSLEHGLGDPDAAALADHGIAALRGRLHDDQHGGWFASVADTTKAAYEHSFVLLAACSAHAAGRPGAEELLTEALEVIGTRFWDVEVGLPFESWDRAWSTTEAYRGANSTMHFVEAFLAAGDVTGDKIWHQRALGLAERIVHVTSAAHGWRVPEHFTEDWRPDLDYNSSNPRHPFRPFGSTIGHWLEWARLLLHLEATLGEDAPAWLLPDARALFDSSVRRGWGVDGYLGFVYTLDWDDLPVVRERMHWVIAEAIMAASALRARTGEDPYADWYVTFWEYARKHHIDPVGGWRHELSPDGSPSAGVWAGKPDTYHAYQATLFPTLPLSPAAALAVR
ncbi:AGE family epimerase/isomerase [Actinokineospora diospyrosa]|uniref:Mannose or cellobiose epimerase, N-acyl-D-glucosamine 2-epimerase family n=1 Tax=Actinokineospora diospyrosa TaxID=103728 RepID=A0ABT1I9D4_9PSEU|nr:AGE family epimerase/isomerase [Actinokineospora diospyrosa]MCP2269197.1 Mannose or cellobiose epimerase, N-acyl-D-glucosamine 2-epimerase family [Actinokineospora diospyrosa]